MKPMNKQFRMTTITKEKDGKYIKVRYNSNIEDLSYKLKYNASQSCLNDNEANNLIQKVELLELLIDEEQIKIGTYKTPLIILTYLPLIESVSSGLDIRSKLTNNELAKMITEGYHKKYTDAINFCNNTIVMFDRIGKSEGYSAKYKDYDKHNELVKEFQLELRTFKMDDFDISFKTMNYDLDEILKLIKSHDTNRN